jgi:hypothetical protein
MRAVHEEAAQITATLRHAVNAIHRPTASSDNGCLATSHRCPSTMKYSAWSMASGATRSCPATVSSQRQLALGGWVWSHGDSWRTARVCGLGFVDRSGVIAISAILPQRDRETPSRPWRSPGPPSAFVQMFAGLTSSPRRERAISIGYA